MPISSEEKWLCEGWAVQVGAAVSAMTGQQGTASLAAEYPSHPDPDDLLIWRQPFDAAPGAELWVAISAAVWKQIGGLVLSSAGLDGDDATELRGTFLEVLQQSLAPLCVDLGARLRREIQTLPGTSVDRLPDSISWQSVQVQVAGRAVGSVWAHCNPALLEVIALPSQLIKRQIDPPEGQKPSRTMDLLMEVELPVGVSFGRAQMRLKDAIKLTTGSIVELNRSIAEPVEIIVNNCVIARGEVVVVEGNYGVRIKHIVSREERLRTLF